MKKMMGLACVVLACAFLLGAVTVAGAEEFDARQIVQNLQTLSPEERRLVIKPLTREQRQALQAEWKSLPADVRKAAVGRNAPKGKKTSTD